MTVKLNLANFMPYQLAMASNAVSDRIAKQYQVRFGLKVPEWRLMAVLGEGTPLTQRDLVVATRMDKVMVSRATANLVDRGLIARAASESDGRSHLLTLTDDGRALYNEIAPAALAMERDVLSCLSAKDKRALADLLARLRAAADAPI
ncbi:MAG: MarR family winged helix-turn-helix transcriptional regulator [Sphingopyxis sp.]